MSFKSFYSSLTLFLTILFVPVWTNSQVTVENPLTKAIQLFDKGNFKEAESLFAELIAKNPDDFMINYFYGACRTENNHYSVNELNYLQKASEEVSPLDIDYYLGVQHHAQENWEQALKHYNKYGQTAIPEDLEKVKLPEKIQQCYDKINPFPVEITIVDTASTNTEILPEETIVITGISESMGITENQSDSLNQDTEFIYENTDSISIPAENPLPVKIIRTEPEKIINFIINSEIVYKLESHFKTEEGKELYETAMEKQDELDESLQQLDFLREKYASTYPRKEKDSIGNIILELENYSYDLKFETNELLMKSKSLENAYWQGASDGEINDFILESNKITEPLAKDFATKIPESTNTNEVEIPEILIQDIDLQTSTQSAASKSELIYKIQIGAFSRGIPSYKKSLFNKISLIRKVDNYTDEKGVVVYTTGNLTKFEDAMVLQKQVRQEGVEDAFIVPYLNGKRITLEQAKEIEGIK